MLAWIGFESVQACRRLRLQAKYGEIYADHDPFQKTLLASQAAMRELDRGKEAERQRSAKLRDERRGLQETVDRILDHMNEVGGIDALSTSERRKLEKASKRLAELDCQAGSAAAAGPGARS